MTSARQKHAKEDPERSKHERGVAARSWPHNSILGRQWKQLLRRFLLFCFLLTTEIKTTRSQAAIGKESNLVICEISISSTKSFNNDRQKDWIYQRVRCSFWSILPLEWNDEIIESSLSHNAKHHNESLCDKLRMKVMSHGELAVIFQTYLFWPLIFAGVDHHRKRLKLRYHEAEDVLHVLHTHEFSQTSYGNVYISSSNAIW